MRYLKSSIQMGVALALLSGSPLQAEEVELISIENDGRGSSKTSQYPSASADGRYVVFESQMTNLVDNDGNGDKYDVYLRDRQTGETSLISVDSDGVQGREESRKGRISPDGRYVVFLSRSQLVPEDTNGSRPDIYLRDLQTGTTELISIDNNGNSFSHFATLEFSISDDGQYVAFQLYDPFSRVALRNEQGNIYEYRYDNGPFLYVRDRQQGSNTLIDTELNGSEPNAYNHNVSISGDGRYLSFNSTNAHLVANDNNNAADIFVYDLQNQSMSSVSRGTDGNTGNKWSYNPSISGDGRYVAFQSASDNLIADDTNNRKDMFRHDRQTGETIRVSVGHDGEQLSDSSGNNESGLSISRDGRYVIFRSIAVGQLLPEGYSTSRYFYAFVRDIQEGTTTLVSPAVPDSRYPWLPLAINSHIRGTAISPDGNLAMFTTTATDLVEPGLHGYNMRVYGYQLANSNQAPIALCQDKVVEAAEQCLASANIDNGSYDLEGDELLISQTPSGLLGLGTYESSLLISDGIAEASCSATVTVQDTTAPQITAGADIIVEATAELTNVTLVTASTDDACGVSYVQNNAPNAYPLGITQVTWTASDASGNSSSATQSVTVVDTIAPENLSCQSPDTITPPNAPVSFTATATDAVSDSMVTVTGYDCFMINGAGKRVDKKDACVVNYQDDTLTILETGGVGTTISWSIQAQDSSANQATANCEITVTNPGKGKAKGKK